MIKPSIKFNSDGTRHEYDRNETAMIPDTFSYKLDSGNFMQVPWEYFYVYYHQCRPIKELR